MRAFFAFACLSFAGAIAPHANAQAGGATIEVGVATDNRSKNASKSEGDPYAWGTIEFETDTGSFYGGSGFETIKSSTGARLELTLEGGARHSVSGWDFDLNAAHKWQVEADAGEDDDAWEFTADVARQFGPYRVGFQLQHSPDGTGDTRSWTWIAARLEWQASDTLDISGGAGSRQQKQSVDYIGWDVGATWALRDGIELDVRYHDTDMNAGDDQYDAAIVASIAAEF